MKGKVSLLLDLLKPSNQSQRPDKFKLELQIKAFDSEDLAFLGAGFEGIINELKENKEICPKLKGVSLKAFTEVSVKEVREFLNVWWEI